MTGGLQPAETCRDAVATAGWLTVHSVDCLRGQPRRTGSRPATPHHFLPNASTRTVILATSRSARAGQVAAPLVSGNIGSCPVFTEGSALDMNRVR